MKEVEDTNKKDIPCLSIRRMHIVKMPILLKEICKFQSKPWIRLTFKDNQWNCSKK